MRTPVVAFCWVLFAFGALRAATPTQQWEQRIVSDVRAGVERAHAAMSKARAAGEKRASRDYAWTLSAMVNLHAKSGDAQLLDWARDDMLWTVDSAIKPDGTPQAFLVSFRNLPPFCEAFIYLKKHGVFRAEEIDRISAQISASLATHYNYTDFGAQNRGLIDGAGFLFAAAAVPQSPEAARWRRYGDALAYDSWNGWSIEDSSIYQPFWLNYSLILADLLGTSDAHLKALTTRFYFDLPKALLTPTGLLPDWGDGDWTHMWMWNVANFVRAGSHYRDGTYLEAARRLYAAHVDFYQRLDGDNLYCAGLALRWLDTGLAFEELKQDRSSEVLEELVAKKITFRSPAGAYALLTYRDVGDYARYQRDYQAAQLMAFEEKPHHGHADENSFALLMDGPTVLLADGGYRSSFTRGWRADVFHNRIVARDGFPAEGDVFDYLRNDTTYHAVRTEKIHFGNFGSLDYARTRLIDAGRGYTGDRVTIFAPENGLTVVIDSILIDRPGTKVFCNTWHPDRVLTQGADYVVSWPERIPIRREYWPNAHTKNLLIQFVGNRDKPTEVREIERRFNRSQAFFQYIKGYFFKGQRLTFVTVLRPHIPGTFDPAMLREVSLIENEHADGRTLGLRFLLGGEAVTVGLKFEQTIGLTNLRGRPMFDWKTGAVNYGTLRTDADFAFVREVRDGTREFGLIYGSRLEDSGRVLFDMPLNTHMYQGPGEFRVAEIKDKMPRWHERAEAASAPASLP